ncbi:hypothetical protein ACLOJK_018637 [Asimina triloba]
MGILGGITKDKLLGSINDWNWERFTHRFREVLEKGGKKRDFEKDADSLTATSPIDRAGET